MPIDFFTTPCEKADCHCNSPRIVCKKTTTNEKFGLCDDPPPAELPAYIQEYRSDEWIADVNNPDLKEITFKAIDHCVPVLRPDGNLESRCDGLLLQDNNLMFIELKDKVIRGWVKEARKQLAITIKYFKENHDISQYNIVEAYACNKQRPLAITSNTSEIQQFKDETADILDNKGLLLKVDRNIQV
jgi:hypothetical protein